MVTGNDSRENPPFPEFCGKKVEDRGDNLALFCHHDGSKNGFHL